MRKLHSAVRGALCTAGIFALAVLLCVLLQRLNVPEHITTVMVFAVFLISLLTDGYVFGVVSALLGALAVNYAFTYPYFALDFLTPVNLISAGVLLTIAVLTGTLTTKLKRQEAARAEAEAERTRANLLRAVSHDLRTPLTSISGSAGLLADQGDSLSPEQRHKLYADIHSDSLWLLSTVENLLSVTRMEEGRMALHLKPELLSEVVGGAMQRLEKYGSTHHLRVEQEDDLLMARIDARLILQVLTNLIDNAVKYTPPGSEIAVRTLRRDGMVVVEVADTGPGIPDADKEKVFEMFYTSAGSDARRGMGLGLALCKSIVNAHGGTISVSDNVPHGAVFAFTLQEERIDLPS